MSRRVLQFSSDDMSQLYDESVSGRSRQSAQSHVDGILNAPVEDLGGIVVGLVDVDSAVVVQCSIAVRR